MRLLAPDFRSSAPNMHATAKVADQVRFLSRTLPNRRRSQKPRRSAATRFRVGTTHTGISDCPTARLLRYRREISGPFFFRKSLLIKDLRAAAWRKMMAWQKIFTVGSCNTPIRRIEFNADWWVYIRPGASRLNDGSLEAGVSSNYPAAQGLRFPGLSNPLAMKRRNSSRYAYEI